MQIHLKKMTRQEYMSLMGVVKWVLGEMEEPTSLWEYNDMDAMRKLLMKMAARSLELKRSVNVTLTDMESHVLYRKVDLTVLDPLTMATMRQVLETMEEQWRESYRMNKANYVAQQMLTEGGEG